MRFTRKKKKLSFVDRAFFMNLLGHKSHVSGQKRRSKRSEEEIELLAVELEKWNIWKKK